MRTLLICLIILLSIGLKAQMFVSDVGLTNLMVKQTALRADANITIVQQLSQATVQTEQLKSTFNLMKEAKETLEDVSNFVSKFRTISNILSNQQYQYDRIKTAIKRFENSKYVTIHEIKQLQSCSSRFLKNTNEIIKTANTVITPGASKMNDAERLNILMKLNDQITNETCAIDFVITSIEDVERERITIARSHDVLKNVFTGQ